MYMQGKISKQRDKTGKIIHAETGGELKSRRTLFILQTHWRLQSHNIFPYFPHEPVNKLISCNAPVTKLNRKLEKMASCLLDKTMECHV